MTYSHLSNISPRNRGSALVTAMIFIMVLSIIAGSFLKLSLGEKRMNERHFAMMEARVAAESLLDVAVAELDYRAEIQTSFKAEDLSSENPHGIKPQQALLSAFEANEFSRTNPDDFEVYATPSDTGLIRQYVDPRNSLNSGSKFKGRFINVYRYELISKATANTYANSPVTAYAAMDFEVVDAPLFSHAVFYNMDLEYHAGPKMIIDGPVHTNGNLWAIGSLPQGSDLKGLWFLDQVTTAGGFHVGLMQPGFQDSWDSSEAGSGRHVYFYNGTNSGAVSEDFVLPNALDGSRDTYTLGFNHVYRGNGTTDLQTAAAHFDSRTPSSEFAASSLTNTSSWEEFARDRFNGYLQTKDNGVGVLKPVAFDDYLAKDDPANTTGQALNYGYSIIEPTMSVASSANPGVRNPFHKGVAEMEKYSFKAGLTMRVHFGGINTPANAVVLSDIDDPVEIAISFQKISRSDPHNPNTAVLTTRTFTETDPVSGDSETVEIGEVQYEDVYIDPTVARAVFRSHAYKETTGSFADFQPENTFEIPSESFFDLRQNHGLDVVEVDMASFKNLIENEGETPWVDADGNVTYDPENEFNGVLYVEFPPQNFDFEAPTWASRPDNIAVAQRVIRTGGESGLTEVGAGLLITNADEIPDPAYNKGINRNPGFTLATNSNLYLKGNYNANGDTSDGLGGQSDNPSNPDTLSSLIADSFTVLSNEFDFERSKLGTRDQYDANVAEWKAGNEAIDTADYIRTRIGGNVEISAAIITGIVPTDENNRSGGNHNYFRLLEAFGMLQYRGSNVAFFESEVGNEPWRKIYYTPPVREWSFFDEFRKGNYPPGTPMLRSTVATNLRYLTAGEFQEKKSNIE